MVCVARNDKYFVIPSAVSEEVTPRTGHRSESDFQYIR